MTRYLTTVAVAALTSLFASSTANAQTVTLNPALLAAQQNVPAAGQRAQENVEDVVRRFRIGFLGGVGLDPEIIAVGAHAVIGPVFTPAIQFRPGLEVGAGEVTTVFGVNLDVLYTMSGFTRDTRWLPYVGAGPNFGLSHRGFQTEEGDHVNVTTTGTTSTTATTGDADDRSRFDFSDTDFTTGMNFIVGMRRQVGGPFFEMRATAWGVSNIRLVAGFNF